MAQTVKKTRTTVVKTESNTIPCSYGTVTVYPNNVTYGLASADRLEQLMKLSVISYQRGWKQDVTRNCRHTKYFRQHYPLNANVKTSSSTYNVYVNAYMLKWNDSNQWVQYTEPTGLPGSELPDPTFNGTAFAAMKPDLEQSMNLSVFLAELTDILSIKGILRRTRSLTRKIAEGHLTWSIGIKPLISDVKSLWDTLANHQQILEDFMAKRGVEQVRHFTNGPITFSGKRDKTTLTACWKLWSEWTGYYQDYATMRYTYDCPNIDSYWDFLRAMRQMLGLRMSASVIWEKIPFSFVVDWIARVGDYFERHEGSAYPVTVVVTDYVCTRKTVYQNSRKVQFCSNLYGLWDTTHTILTESKSTYHRVRQHPDSEGAFINSGQYGLNQLALSASLIRTRVR